MQSFELTYLQEELKRRQALLRGIDDKLTQEMAKQTVLEELYGDSSMPSSESSRSGLNQSSISQRESESASVNSSFLRQEISNVYNFMRERNAEKEVNQTGTRTHLLDTNMMTKPQHAHIQKQELSHYKQNEQQHTSFFHRTTKDPHAISKLIQKQQLKRKWEQEQAERQKEMHQFLQEKQRMRQKSIQRERMKIRQQLLKQQNRNKQNIYLQQQKPMKTVNINVKVFDNDVLKLERNRALSRLLKDVQKQQKNMRKLIQRTRAPLQK